MSVRSDGVQGGGHSAVASLSGNGRYVAFASNAADLAPGGLAGVNDIFVHDTWSGATERVSISTAGAPADDHSYGPVLSHDGRFVVFGSVATNLVPGDTNGVRDIFVHDRQLDTTQRVSVDPSGGNAETWSYYATISANGRFICFQSDAGNITPGDVNGIHDIFVRDLWTNTTELVSVDSSGSPTELFEPSVEAVISANGRYVVFASTSGTLAPGATAGMMQVFVRDRAAGTTELVSVGPNGVTANGDCTLPSISSDGRFVVFTSSANNLVAGDTNGFRDIFVRDRLSGTTERVSLAHDGSQAAANCLLYYSHATISGDGRYVLFESEAGNLVPNDGNGWNDVFRRDRLLGTTERVNVSTTGAPFPLGAYRGALSADGDAIVFESPSGQVIAGDTNGNFDVFLHRRSLVTEPISVVCSEKVNSLGCPPAIGASGVPTLTGADAFFVTVTSVRSHQPGLLVLSFGPAQTPFAGGFLCVAPPLIRTPFQDAGGSSAATDCTGSYSFHLSQAYFASKSIGAGTTLWAQWVSRDPGFAPPNALGLSAALTFTTAP